MTSSTFTSLLTFKPMPLSSLLKKDALASTDSWFEWENTGGGSGHDDSCARTLDAKRRASPHVAMMAILIIAAPESSPYRELAGPPDTLSPLSVIAVGAACKRELPALS